MELDQIVEMLPGPGVVHAGDGRLLAANADGVAVLAELIDEPGRPVPWAGLSSAQDSVELPVRCGDSVGWVLATSRRTTWRGDAATVTTFVDSTERQSWARSMIDEFVGRFRMSWARSELPVFLVGVDGEERGVVLACNDGSRNLLGRDAAAIEGSHLHDLFRSANPSTLDIDDHLSALISGAATSTTVLAEHDVAHSGMSPGQVRLGLTCSSAPTGRPLFVLGYAIDQAPLRRAEALERRAELRSELIHRHSSDGVIVVQADGTIDWIGPSTAGLLGHDRRRTVGTNAVDLVHPQDRPLAIEALGSTATQPGVAAPLALRAVDADGAVRSVEVVATNLLDEPSVGGIVLNIRDRSGEAAAAAELEVRERRYRRIVDLAFDGIALLDAGLRISFANERLCSILGRPQHHLVGSPALDLIPTEERDRLTALMVDQAGERVEGFPLTLLDGRGEAVSVLVSAAPLGEDPADGAVAWITDVSESDRARAELRWSEARLQALLGALPDLIFRLSSDGTHLDHHCNDPELLAVPPEQFLGRRIAEVLPDSIAPGVATRFERAIDEVLRTEAPTTIRYELEVAAGHRQFEARISPLRAGEVLSVVRDMSDLHRSEQLRLEQQRDLERSLMATERAEIERELERATRLEAVGHLAASVAHDVNNLLGVIKNYASAVNRRGVDDETADDLVGIDRAVARGAELTQRLLRLGRSDSADAESISVRRVLDELRPTLERLFDGSPGIDVDVLLGDDDCTTVASRSGLERAVINLVLNSRDAYSDTGRSGTVVVLLDGPHPSADPSDGSQEIRVRVSDRAGGIPPQVRDDLLEPFVSTKGERGSGLGLTIVQRAARQHRGRVEINTGDDGTEVQLVLPMIQRVHPSEPAAARTWSVLVVDDDDDLRASACRLLAGFGCTTIEAVDMVDALGQLEQSHHDLVLSDVRMPGGSGVDLLRELRRNGSKVPVVLMTGHPGDLEELGDDLDPVVVQKPFAAMELFAAMTRALT